MYKARVIRELDKLSKCPPTGYTILGDNTDNNMTLQVTTSIGTGNVKLTVPERYPIHPPIVAFIAPVPFHPNIDRNGNICLDLLKAEGWRPTYDLFKVLEAVRLLLDYPNVDDPLNLEAAELYTKDRQAYNARNMNIAVMRQTVMRRPLSSSADGAKTQKINPP